MEDKGASAEEIRELLGRGRARKGIFEGDLIDGELEIGQVASTIPSVISAKQVVDEMISEFNEKANEMSKMRF